MSLGEENGMGVVGRGSGRITVCVAIVDINSLDFKPGAKDSPISKSHQSP